MENALADLKMVIDTVTDTLKEDAVEASAGPAVVSFGGSCELGVVVV